MSGAVRLAIVSLALSTGIARAADWVVFPVTGGAVAYYDSLLENKQTGAILLTVAAYTHEPRKDPTGDYRYAFESWQVNCKTITMKPEKVVRYLTIGLPATIDREFDAAQAWVKPGDNGWAQLVVQIACTDAQAPNAQRVANQPAAMEAMAKLGADVKP